jgi:long-chain acyl-CoA synthetase
MAEFETLVELWEQSLDKYGSNPLFGVKERGEYEWITYSEFGEQVDAFRGALAEMGVEHGDTVGIIADNCVEWAAAAHATYGRGAKYCPMYEAQQDDEWKYIIEDSGAKVVLTADREIYDTVEPWIDEIETLERVIDIEGPSDHDDAWSRQLEIGEENPVEVADIDREDIAGFIYTSGTTGKPKGVLLSHWNICSNLSSVYEVMPLSQEDVSLSFLPWAHSFGQVAELHMLTSKGASMGLVEDVETILENAAEVRPTLLFSVPRIFNKIYDAVQKQMRESSIKRWLFNMALRNSERLAEQKESGQVGALTGMLDGLFDRLVFQKVRNKLGGRLKYAFSGGAALSPEVAQFIDALHITVYEGYGLTETSPIATVNRPGERKIGSVGKSIPGVEISIDDDPRYEGDLGEICIKGPNVMQGYHNMPDKTDEVVDEDGAFHSGDLGRIDEDGFLWIEGRVKEQFKLENGKYVAPAPAEEQYKLSPYIEQIMIEGTGCPHTVALIVVNEMELREYFSGQDLEHADTDELLEDERVRQLYDKQLGEWGEEVKAFERPKDFVLTAEEFTPENDMLTPTLKLKRRNVMAKYGDQLADLYDEAVPLAAK